MKKYNSYFYDVVIVVDTIGSKAQQLEESEVFSERKPVGLKQFT